MLSNRRYIWKRSVPDAASSSEGWQAPTDGSSVFITTASITHYPPKFFWSSLSIHYCPPRTNSLLPRVDLYWSGTVQTLVGKFRDSQSLPLGFFTDPLQTPSRNRNKKEHKTPLSSPPLQQFTFYFSVSSLTRKLPVTDRNAEYPGSSGSPCKS